jgi:hypothetical protein
MIDIDETSSQLVDDLLSGLNNLLSAIIDFLTSQLIVKALDQFEERCSHSQSSQLHLTVPLTHYHAIRCRTSVD